MAHVVTSRVSRVSPVRGWCDFTSRAPKILDDPAGVEIPTVRIPTADFFSRFGVSLLNGLTGERSLWASRSFVRHRWKNIARGAQLLSIDFSRVGSVRFSYAPVSSALATGGMHLRDWISRWRVRRELSHQTIGNTRIPRQNYWPCSPICLIEFLGISYRREVVVSSAVYVAERLINWNNKRQRGGQV